MKRQLLSILSVIVFITMTSEGCDDTRPKNTSALDEQAHTETNQRSLLQRQPPPNITWSLERDNLIKRFKLQNDRTVMFYMYVFNEGVQDPIGYYQVNKVSSVNSQLTNTMQAVDVGHSEYHWEVMPSPAEDGSYGENGDGVFGFTPEDVYIEHNMNYIVSTVPLTFKNPVNRLLIIDVKTQAELKGLMDRLNKS